jgi:hypothetical protein
MHNCTTQTYHSHRKPRKCSNFIISMFCTAKISHTCHGSAKNAKCKDPAMRVSISFTSYDESIAIDTTIRPKRMMGKNITTALYVIGISIAIASPLLNNVSSAFATVLLIQKS